MGTDLGVVIWTLKVPSTSGKKKKTGPLLFVPRFTLVRSGRKLYFSTASAKLSTSAPCLTNRFTADNFRFLDIHRQFFFDLSLCLTENTDSLNYKDYSRRDIIINSRLSSG